MEKSNAIENVQLISDISQQTVYLMGCSFVIGSMFTLFVLLILDWVRRDTSNDK